MNLLEKCVLVTATTAWAVASCKAGKGPRAPEEQAEYSESNAGAISGSNLPIGPVEGQEIILGQGPGETPNDGTQSNVPPGDNQQTPPANGAPGGGPPSPTPTPSATPAPAFYPASCAEIKKAQSNALSGIFKIYLNATLDTRVAVDASCDMSEDGGGWTLVLNYSHKGNTNPPLSTRTLDLPLLAGDTLGTDESALTKNWGHTGNAMISNFKITELRFYCRTSQNNRIIHFKTQDAGCISAAKTGLGSCLNVRTGFVKLTGHTGVLPGAADQAKNDEGNFALTRESFAQNQVGNDTTWSISGNNSNSWECDFGSNTAANDTIHRVWFR